jgi:hypothetical protein
MKDDSKTNEITVQDVADELGIDLDIAEMLCLGSAQEGLMAYAQRIGGLEEYEWMHFICWAALNRKVQP